MVSAVLRSEVHLQTWMWPKSSDLPWEQKNHPTSPPVTDPILGLEYVYSHFVSKANFDLALVCPNGRIPAIVDHDRNDFAVFEGSAILTYLTRHYDTDHKLSFEDEDDKSRAEQWMAWQHGGVGPMQGQANRKFSHTVNPRLPSCRNMRSERGMTSVGLN